MSEAFNQITPALMQSLLGPRFPNLTVNGVTVDGAIHGTATKVKVHLDATGDGPRTMWVKAGWEDSSEILRKVGIFAREPRVYAELLPPLGLEAPACYGAQWDDEAMDGIVLLEDLAERQAHFNTPVDALSPDTVAAALSALARMHGLTHSAEWRAAHEWIRPLFADAVEPDSYLAYVSNPATLAQFLELPRRDSIPEAARTPDGISAAMMRTVAVGVADEERCMIHGDAHIGNSYTLPDGTFGILDWQCVWWGSWAFDVAYFIGSALSPDDRRTHEVALVQHYINERARHGRPCASIDAAMERYRAYLAYGLTVWLTNQPSFQAEEYNAAVASRFAYALLDHNMLGA